LSPGDSLNAVSPLLVRKSRNGTQRRTKEFCSDGGGGGGKKIRLGRGGGGAKSFVVGGGGGGVQQIQLRTEDGGNVDLGAVAP